MSADRSDPGLAGGEEDLADLYDNAPCGYVSLRPDARIVMANATFAAWTGYEKADLAGMKLHELLSVGGRIFYETHVAPLLRMQGFFNEIALDLVTRTGERLPVLANAAEKRDSEGGHLLTRITVFNATGRRHYERELVAARAAAEATAANLRDLHADAQAKLLAEREAAAPREQSIAILGHDLRNPLNAINSAAAMLLETPLNEEATGVVAMMRGCTSRMFGLIDGMVDFARFRLAGGVKLDRNEAEPISPVLEQAAAELRAAAPGAVIETRFAIGTPVACDRLRIGQLASNLLGNALTHGAPDTPVRMEAATEGGWFVLSVRNLGVPIPPARMAHIFEPFSRDTHRRNRHGLGLGLYIAHEIARAHGGTLDVISNETETRFTFRMRV